MEPARPAQPRCWRSSCVRPVRGLQHLGAGAAADARSARPAPARRPSSRSPDPSPTVQIQHARRDRRPRDIAAGSRVPIDAPGDRRHDLADRRAHRRRLAQGLLRDDRGQAEAKRSDRRGPAALARTAPTAPSTPSSPGRARRLLDRGRASGPRPTPARSRPTTRCSSPTPAPAHASTAPSRSTPTTCSPSPTRVTNTGAAPITLTPVGRAAPAPAARTCCSRPPQARIAASLGTYGAEKEPDASTTTTSTRARASSRTSTAAGSRSPPNTGWPPPSREQGEPVQMQRLGRARPMARRPSTPAIPRRAYTIQPGQSVTKTARIFAGAKRVRVLERYENDTASRPSPTRSTGAGCSSSPSPSSTCCRSSRAGSARSASPS